LLCASINVRERPWASKRQPIDYKRCCTDRLNAQGLSGHPSLLVDGRATRSGVAAMRLFSISREAKARSPGSGLLTLVAYGRVGLAGTHTNCAQVLRERPGTPATGSFA
jgi:hypothetical protein